MELPTLEQVNTVMKASIPLVESCRIEIVELEPGYAKTRAPFEGNGNHLGTMYAGVLFTVAEVIGGVMAAVTFDMTRFLPLVRSMEIDFRRAARSDVTAEARLEPEVIEGAIAAADADGKAPYELRATVSDASGEVVATTVAQYQIRRHGTT
jgi:acyl-coenzyme A thioesterase PaaI-like protein